MVLDRGVFSDLWPGRAFVFSVWLCWTLAIFLQSVSWIPSLFFFSLSLSDNIFCFLSSLALNLNICAENWTERWNTKKKGREKYASFWVFSSVKMLILAVLPSSWHWLTCEVINFVLVLWSNCNTSALVSSFTVLFPCCEFTPWCFPSLVSFVISRMHSFTSYNICF